MLSAHGAVRGTTGQSRRDAYAVRTDRVERVTGGSMNGRSSESSTRTIYSDFVEYAEQDARPPENPVSGTLYALDANILLNLYKFTPDAAHDVLRALRTMRDVLFVPHQALNEFWPLRDGVRTGPHHNEAVGKLQTANAEITRVVRTWQKRTGLGAEGGEEGEAGAIDDHLDAVDDALEKIAGVIESVREESTDGGEWLLAELDVILVGRIGERPSDQERDATLREFSRRVEKGIPPGLRDVEIRKGKTQKASGDYFIWKQCLEEARAVSESRGSAVDLTLVTEDHKDDWVRASDEPRLLAHRALVKEYHEAVGGTFRIIAFEDLLDTASKFFGAQVSSSSRAQVMAQKTATGQLWTRDYALDYIAELWNYGNQPQLMTLFAAWHLEKMGEPPLLLTETAQLVGRTGLRGFGRAYSGALARMDALGTEFLEPMLKRVFDDDQNDWVYEIQGGAGEVLGDIIAEDSDYVDLLSEAKSRIAMIRADV